MDKKAKTKWVKALRSGKYRKGSGQLHKAGRFCCIGVLEHVVFKRPIHILELYNGSLVIKDEYCGIDIGTRNTLADMNDGGKTFAEIADYIEAKL